ncbi:MAG: hypothetical protein AAGF12_25660 [Myxococcota bacterium]
MTGGENPLAAAVLPDGSFCVDVPMPTPGSYAFGIRSQGATGLFSETMATADVVFDSGAPPVAGATTCAGSSPLDCMGGSEICDNDVDDDCNSLIDFADPACQSCQPDILEPNDEFASPRLDPGRYENLRLCSGESDYYGIFANEGDVIEVRAFFTHADGDLDLVLFDSQQTMLTSASTMDDDEVLAFPVTATDQLVLQVVGVAGAENEYVLNIVVSENL